ncbi:hypothetical protein [Chryseobacterium chendengshani]|uniref:hypothetical protein n=1 Tax=Chryseobacterium sp. LJ756 TaxID=2864113 RepID=UPI00215A3DAF|nr:hypothetical protein [Chryseobacterium sp. LJ756]
MKIKKLEKLTSNPTLNWEFNSYATDKIFSVSSIEIGNTFEFSLKVNINITGKSWKQIPRILKNLIQLLNKDILSSL